MSKFTEFLDKDGEKVSIYINKVTAVWRDDDEPHGIINISPSIGVGSYSVNGSLDDLRRQVESYGHHTIPFARELARETGFFVAEMVTHYHQSGKQAVVCFKGGKLMTGNSYEDVKKSIDDALCSIARENTR